MEIFGDVVLRTVQGLLDGFRGTAPTGAAEENPRPPMVAAVSREAHGERDGLNDGSSGNGTSFKNVWTTCDTGNENVTLPLNVPSIMIIGTMKGGTTALSWVLKSHPNLVGDIREKHFLDKNRLPPMATPQQICSLRKMYLESAFDLDQLRRAMLKQPERQVITLDKTPSYLRTFDAASTAHQLFRDDGGDWSSSKGTTGVGVKIVALLRDPVTRIYSEFNMKRRDPQFPTFDEFVENHHAQLKSLGITNTPSPGEYAANRSKYNNEDRVHHFAPPTPSLTMQQIKQVTQARKEGIRENALWTGMYAPQIAEWANYFELGKSFHVVHYEKLNAEREAGFRRISEELLNLPPYEYSTKVTDASLLGNPSTSSRKHSEVSDVMEEYLRLLYRPYNAELPNLLGNDWEGIWK